MTDVVKSVTERITPRQFHETDGVQEWRFVAGGASTYFRTGSIVAGARHRPASGHADRLRTVAVGRWRRHALRVCHLPTPNVRRRSSVDDA